VPLSSFWTSLFFVGIAEMGDKTQLVALACAARYSARTTLAAVLAATLLVHLFSVAIGEVFGLALPTFWVQIVAGVAFLGFAAWTLRGDTLDDGEAKEPTGRWGPFIAIAVSFFIAELGDKTMLTTVTLASQQQEFVSVWLGSSIGMVIADGLAIVVGSFSGRRLPEKAIRLAAAGLFAVSGLWSIATAFLGAR
jgi:putative Ca2+/H+ antiporter (TMEM165/GDT1 family)